MSNRSVVAFVIVCSLAVGARGARAQAASGAASRTAARGPQVRNVAILVHEGVELLDFAGPGEVFSAAGNGAFEVFTVGPTRAPIVSQGFVRITPDYGIADSPRPDILIIPGGNTAVLYNDAKMMSWIKERAGEAEIVMSVCNGAITLARTGLLDGLKATTHWGAVAGLQKFARVTVTPNERFVDNGHIISTQGVSAGIDGALHVVQRLLGPEAAWADARYMMYHWEPAGLSATALAELRPWVERDWAAVEATYARKLAADPGDVLAASRLGIALQEKGQHERAVAALERALSLGAKDPDVLDELGDARFALGKYEAAARAYQEEMPLRSARAQPFVELSLAKAWSRAGNKEAAVGALEKSAASGHFGRRSLEQDPDLAGLRGDPRFEAAVRRAP